MKNIVKTAWYCWDKTDRFIAIFSIIAIIVLLCTFPTKCSAGSSRVTDTITNPYEWNSYEEGYMPLNFESIYYIDTTNMVIYYDDYDQFDMDNEYEINPCNINEDGNLMIHINKDNLIELMNRILQWMSLDSIKEHNERYYIESMFGIGETDEHIYYITYLGN